MPGSCWRRKHDNSLWPPEVWASMSSFEWNKIIASVLTALIIAMVSGILANQLVRPRELEKPVFVVQGEQTASAPAEQQPAAAKLEPIGPLLAKADPKKGEQLAKVCQTCHTFNKGEPNKIGPNLWDVTEEQIASVPGYQFSAALEKDKNEKWDPEKLNEWLHNPQSFAKGTKMTFAGFPKAQDRVDVIAYLNTLK